MHITRLKDDAKAYSRAPLRLGFAGGGTDVDPFCSEFGGRVLNATIAKYVFARVSKSADGPKFVSLDQNLTVNLGDFSSEARGTLPLHENAYKFVSDKYFASAELPVTIETYTDAPVGSGLGTSSTLVVAVIAAMFEYLAISATKYDIAEAAQIIEREMCGFAGGRQDSYSATFGGFNYMEFEKDSNIVNPLRIPKQTLLTLESNLLLFHMGTSRVSSNIIKDQANSVNHVNEASWQAMMRIRGEAESMKKFFLTSDMSGVIQSLKAGWANKKATSSAVSNDHIDEIYDEAMAAGAQAGKVSGAGGGGFMLFYVEIEDRPKLISKLETMNGFTSNVEFSELGVESWTQH
jgi:D-glycero-alpha-D-manno-heptose-7-phosphate kinase